MSFTMAVIAFIAVGLVLLGCLIGSELDSGPRYRRQRQRALVKRELWEHRRRF